MTPYWTRVIKRAKERKAQGLRAFTTKQWDRAHDWPDCACGRQDERILRSEKGVPVDDELCRLGNAFAKAVTDNAPAEAGRALVDIENRARVLIGARMEID